jgi:enoyl-CoA hydratase/carnithine racemase
VAEVILNNPAKLNCMGFEMLTSLSETLDDIISNPEIRVLLIKGAGDRAFSTGADLKEFRSLDSAESAHWIEYGNQLFNRIEDLPLPTVAYIHGYAMGGGLELALACDFRIGTTKGVISSPELQHGWLPGWGGMARLRRIIGEARAKEVVMLNQPMDAEQSYNLGLLTRVLDEKSEEEELSAFLGHLAQLNPSSFRLAKKALMDANRTTRDGDLEFDILAMQVARRDEAKD